MSTFSFTLPPASAEELVGFAFDLVLDAAWLRWQAQLDVEKTLGIELDREARINLVERVFNEAIERLSPDNPFREPLRRYIAEHAIPIAEQDDPRDTPPPRPKLSLVRE